MKGSLRAPVQTPKKRSFEPWYKRRSIQIAIGATLLVLIAIVVWAIFQARAEARAIRRDVEAFERTLQVQLTAPGQLNQELAEAPNQFQDGHMTAEEFSERAENWLDVYRDLHTGLREMETPLQVEESRALFVQGVSVYLDAIKSFLLGADLEEGDERAKAISQGRSMLDHGQAVLFMGSRSLELVKVELGLAEEAGNPVLEAPLPLPEEDVLPPIPGLEDFTPPGDQLVDPNASPLPEVPPGGGGPADPSGDSEPGSPGG